jgi:hypothetical protein
MVVFFCGAGISYPAGLPDFKGLVEQLIAKLGTSFMPAERQAYENDQFDATLFLIEQRFPGRRGAVRAAVADILKPKLRRKNATKTHEAILELSRDSNRDVRLVTTNFDRIFESILASSSLEIPHFPAPYLPIPKKSRWHGIVYLHGLLPKIPNEKDLDRLVLSSGDFGLAYLTERWASRFVGELFRTYTVCFVGYSISDPVLRYMMDALAADRMLGESSPEAFAFGGFEIGCEESARTQWESKGVTPVLYQITPLKRDHSALHRTLEEWAGIYRDGVLGKESVVCRRASKMTQACATNDYPGAQAAFHSAACELV